MNKSVKKKICVSPTDGENPRRNISSGTSRPMTEAGSLACYDISSHVWYTVYVEIVGSSSPRIAARGARLVKVIVTRVRT